MLIERINLMKCYLSGAVIQAYLYHRHVHHIVTFTMLCAKAELVSVTWLEIFVVKKTHNTV